MNNKAFGNDRSVTYHLNGNARYDSHLKALRDIYFRKKAGVAGMTSSRRAETAPETNESMWARRNKENTFKLNSVSSIRLMKANKGILASRTQRC